MDTQLEIQLTTSQQFEIERFKRVIDEAQDVAALQKISKELLQAWQLQKAAAVWAFSQSLPAPLHLTNVAPSESNG
jgi:hypothetical protein